VTEPTLRHVLLQTGVDEAELDDLRYEALASGPVDPDVEIMPEPAAELPVEPDADEEDDLPEEEILYAEEIPDPALDKPLAPPVEEDTPAPVDEDEDEPPSIHSSHQLSLF
jgi:hypothetical protein